MVENNRWWVDAAHLFVIDEERKGRELPRSVSTLTNVVGLKRRSDSQYYSDNANLFLW